MKINKKKILEERDINNIEFIKNSSNILINFCKNNDFELEKIDFPDDNTVEAKVKKNNISMEIKFNSETNNGETTVYTSSILEKPEFKEINKDQDIDKITNEIIGLDYKVDTLFNNDNNINNDDKETKIKKINYGNTNLSNMSVDMKQNYDMFASLGRKGTEVINNNQSSVLNLGTSTKNIENLNDETDLMKRLRENNAPDMIKFAVEHGFPNRGYAWLEKNKK